MRNLHHDMNQLIPPLSYWSKLQCMFIFYWL